MYYAKINTLKPNFKFIIPLKQTTKLSEFRTLIQETIGLHFSNSYTIEHIMNAEGFEFIGDYEVGDIISCGEVVDVIVRVCKLGEMTNKRLCPASKRKRTATKREESIGLELKEEDCAKKVEFGKIDSEFEPVSSRIEKDRKKEEEMKSVFKTEEIKNSTESTKSGLKTDDTSSNETIKNLGKKSKTESIKGERQSELKSNNNSSKNEGTKEETKNETNILKDLKKKKKSVQSESENVENISEKSKNTVKNPSIKDISNTVDEDPIEDENKVKKIEKKVEKFNKLIEENHKIENEFEKKKYEFRPASVKKKNKKGESIFKG